MGTMNNWVYRPDGRFQSVDKSGWFRSDGSRGGILPPPRGAAVQNVGYGEPVRGNVPYRVIDGNRVFADLSGLYGPNGTATKVEVLRGLGKVIGSAPYYYDMLPGEKCYSTNGALTTILVRVTDNQGGTTLIEQPIGIMGRAVDAYGDPNITGKGEWQYIRATPGEVRPLQIVLWTAKTKDYPRSADGTPNESAPKTDVLPGNWGRVRCEWVQLEGPPAALKTKVYQYVEDHTSNLTKYMNNEVTIPSGLNNGDRVGFRVKTTFPDHPDWPVQWSSYYYFEVVTQPAPASAQTFPRASAMWPAGSWVTTPAAKIPYATAGTKTLNVWGTPTQVTLYSEAEQRTEFLRQMKAYNGGIACTTREFAAALYIVDASTPRYDVRWVDFYSLGWGGGPTDPVQSRYVGVPVPDGATPALGTDGHIGFYSPSTDQYWEFWQWHRDEKGRFWAAAGGRVDNFSTSNGQLRSGSATFTVSASGLACAATSVKAAEMLEALSKYSKTDQSAWDDCIGHVMTMAAPQNRQGVISWPAHSTDGNNSAEPRAMIEGQRFSIDQSLDLTQIAWRTPGEHIICRAMQKYGVMVVDTGGSLAASFQSAYSWQLATGSDPYAGVFGDGMAKPNQWNITELIPDSAWRVHQHFKDEAEWKAAVPS